MSYLVTDVYQRSTELLIKQCAYDITVNVILPKRFCGREFSSMA